MSAILSVAFKMVALSAMAEMMRQSNLKQQRAEALPGKELMTNPLSLLFDKQRDTKMKLMMAEQFADLGTDAMGSTINELLVKDRNAAAMKVFQKDADQFVVWIDSEGRRFEGKVDPK